MLWFESYSIDHAQDVRRDFFFDILCVIYPLRISTTEPCARRMYQRVPGCCDFSNVARVFRAGHWEGSWSFFLGWKLFSNSDENPTKNTYVKTGVSICWCLLEYIGVQGDVYCCKPWLGHVESCCAANLHECLLLTKRTAVIPWTWKLSFGINGIESFFSLWAC